MAIVRETATTASASFARPAAYAAHSSPYTLDAVIAAINLAGQHEEPVAIPLGELGGCIACGRTAESHWRDGQWVGCLGMGVTPDTVFILVPATRQHAQTVIPKSTDIKRRTAFVMSPRPLTPSPQPEAGPVASEPQPKATAHAMAPTQPAVVNRAFARARYVTMLHHKAKPEKLPLSPTRLRVLKKIHEAGRSGLVAKQIMSKAKLPHGSVQSTLDWLRAHKLVEAREDMPPSTPTA